MDFDDYSGFVTADDHGRYALVKCPSRATDKQWREFFCQTREVWPIRVLPMVAAHLKQQYFAAECFREDLAAVAKAVKEYPLFGG